MHMIVAFLCSICKAIRYFNVEYVEQIFKLLKLSLFKQKLLFLDSKFKQDEVSEKKYPETPIASFL